MDMGLKSECMTDHSGRRIVLLGKRAQKEGLSLEEAKAHLFPTRWIIQD